MLDWQAKRTVPLSAADLILLQIIDINGVPGIDAATELTGGMHLPQEEDRAKVRLPCDSFVPKTCARGDMILVPCRDTVH